MSVDPKWYHESLRRIMSRVGAMTASRTHSHLLGEAGFAHVFPERDMTDARILEVLGLGPRFSEGGPAGAGIVQVKQVHGATVALAQDASRRAVCEADAIVARAAHGRVAVGVRVADCVPVLIASIDTGDVAAVHAGWRGVTAGVVAASVEALGGGGLVAAIGPCIGACCFEVGRDVADAIARAAPGAPVIAPYPHASPDKVFVDLRVAVRHQLRNAGVDPARIEDVPGCTRHESVRFHSFRRDGKDSGRMLAVIVTSPVTKPAAAALPP
jgi:purine-nucleoside/S-methyl-5'-thioadenosine phosphorylase / adenosine deaminase